MYLINVTVGEEYAYCRSCAKDSCKTEKTYEFNDEVWLQCLTNSNGTWWSETTDFCYMKNSDFWESPEGDCKSAIFRLIHKSGMIGGKVIHLNNANEYHRLPHADLREIWW